MDDTDNTSGDPPQPTAGSGPPEPSTPQTTPGTPETFTSPDQPRQSWDFTPVAAGGAPPASRGPVPFQEMRLGQLLDSAIKVYRSRWAMFIGITAAIVVPYLALSAIAEALVVPDVETLSTTVPPPGSVVASLVVGLLSLGMYVFVTPFLTGAMAKATSEIYLGGSPSSGNILRFTWSIFGSLLLVSILVFLAVLGGFFLLIIGAIIFGLRFYLSAPVLVIEGLKGREAMKRSWGITKGEAGKVFVTLFVSGLLASIVTAIIQFPLQAIGFAVGGDTGIFFGFLGTAIGTVITTPFAGIVAVLLYYDLRIRKEGYDLALMAQDMGQPPSIG